MLVTSPGAVQPPPFASDVPNLDPSTLFAIIEETQSVDIPAVLASTTPPTLGSGSSLTEQLAAIAFGQLAAEAVAPLPGNSAAGSATALQEAAFADAIVETLDDVDVETGPTSAFSPPTEAQSIAAAVFDTSVA